jgi:hypothetical protein
VDVRPGVPDGLLDGGQRLLAVDQHLNAVAVADRRAAAEEVLGAGRLEDLTPAQVSQSASVVSAQGVLEAVAKPLVHLVQE